MAHHPAVQDALDFLALAEEIGDEHDVAQANVDLNRIIDKLTWTIAHRHCDHAYGICSERN